MAELTRFALFDQSAPVGSGTMAWDVDLAQDVQGSALIVKLSSINAEREILVKVIAYALELRQGKNGLFDLWARYDSSDVHDSLTSHDAGSSFG